MSKSKMALRVVVRNGERIRLSELQVGDEFVMFEAEGEAPIGTFIAASEPAMLNDVWSVQVNIKESV